MDEFKALFFDLFLLLIFVLLNAFFVAAEFAIVKVRKTQIKPLAETENKRAKIAIKLITHLDEYLSATQLGITITSLGLGWIGEPVTSRLLIPFFKISNITNPETISTISISVGFLLITFLHIILGELAPKSIAIRHPKVTSLYVSIPLNLFYLIFRPLIRILNGTANLILKLFGIKPVTESERFHSEEELRLLITEGSKSGVIDSTEYQLIEKIFEFNDKSASDIMIPRNNIVALNVDDSREKIIKTVIESGFSRIPVFKETIDNIVGIIYAKDLISVTEHREIILLRDVLRPVYFIPETKHIGEILKEFQKKRIHLGIVVNEHGGIEGLVTLEDIIEEIVGEIEDEYDVETRNIQKDKLGIYLINPIIPIEEFNKKFNANIPIDPDEYLTLSGFLQKVTGHVPEIFERVDHKGFVFTIMKKIGNKLLQVKIQRMVT